MNKPQFLDSERFMLALRERSDEQFDVPVVVKIGKDWKHVKFAGLSMPSGRYALEVTDAQRTISEINNPLSLVFMNYGASEIFLRCPDETEKRIVKLSEKRSYANKYNAVIPAVILELEA